MQEILTSEKRVPAKSADFVGGGAATERADFGGMAAEGAERSLWRRGQSFAPDGRPLAPDGLFLMDGIEGLRSLPRHSVDMLLTDPPYGTTRNYWDVPLPLPELWEAVRWAVKPEGAVLLFAQCPYDKVLGASNLPMLRYESVPMVISMLSSPLYRPRLALLLGETMEVLSARSSDRRGRSVTA